MGNLTDCKISLIRNQYGFKNACPFSNHMAMKCCIIGQLSSKGICCYEIKLNINHKDLYLLEIYE